MVLAAGGAGAVGYGLIRLARWAGVTVISTVSDPEKDRLATASGAHHAINCREGGPAAEIRKITPDGVDIVAEVALDANLALDLAVRTRASSSWRCHPCPQPWTVCRRFVGNTAVPGRGGDAVARLTSPPGPTAPQRRSPAPSLAELR
ncbi:zinc-binding dehydrogenase [Streptomyces sp. NPDC006356]